MGTIALTPEQHTAATTIDRSVGIVANAGSGKTRVLVERVAHILEAQKIPLHQILVVTFTEKAAQELKKRLAERLPERRMELMTAAITTFHGFAMRVLREHAPALGISPGFRIASAGESSDLLHRSIEETILSELRANDPDITLLCQHFPFRTLITQLTPLLEDRWSFSQHIQNSKPTSEIISAISTLFEKTSTHYWNLKTADDVLDFHDLEILTWKLFRDDSRILSDYQRQFKHLLVDEFQDTNPLQSEIVRQLFTPPDNILCVVGDPKQSIYRFRRADVACFAEMLAVIAESGGETIVLPDNFRSQPGIVDFVNTTCSDMPDYTPLIARRDALSESSVLRLSVAPDAGISADARRTLEAQVLSSALPAIARDNGGFGKIACLFQARATLQLWADELRAAGIPVHVYGSGGFWERPEVRALIYALQVLVGIQRQAPDERHLLAMLISPLFSVSLDEIYQWMHLVPKTGNEDLPPLHRAIISHSAIGAQIDHWLMQSKTRTAFELFSGICANTDYLNRLNASDPSGQMRANAESFLNRLHEMGASSARPLASILDQILALRDMNERTPDTPATLTNDDAVQLMTIHAAKGNEFPVVVIPDLLRKPSNQVPQWLFEPGVGFAVRYENDFDATAKDTDDWTAIRDQYAQDEMAERRRLLYVALTRAESQLILPLHSDMMEKGGKTWHDLLRQ